MTMLASIIKEKQLRPKIALAVLLTSIITISQIDGRPAMNVANTMVQQASATISSSSSSSSSYVSSYYRYNHAYSADPTTRDTYVTIQTRNDNDHPPIAYSQSIQTAQNTPVGIQFKAVDPDAGDTIRYAIVSQPSHGVLNSINYAFSGTTYIPNNGFSGTDSFSIQAFDRNRLVSNIAAIYITVSKVNHSPIAYSQSIQTAQNTPVGIHLSAADSDSGDIITSFAIVSMPGRGVITNFDQSSGTLTYTPYAGIVTATTDRFAFNVIDNHGTISKTGVVSIAISSGPR